MGLKVANNAYGLLAAGISDSDTVIALQSGHGARFGTIVAGSGDYMFATLLNASNQLEVVKITDISTDALTVSRGEDGTTPLAYSSGDRLEARPCAGVVNDLIALSNFVQVGTGAVARTAQGKNQDIVSAFDFMTTAEIADVKARTASVNVTAAVQAAIDALSAVGGGALYFPAGIYLMQDVDADGNAIELPSNVFLVGAGIGATVLKLADTSDDNIIAVVGNVTNFSIAHMTIDGNAANQTTTGNNINVNGGASGASDFAIINVETKDAKNSNCNLTDVIRGVVLGSVSKNSGSDGFSISSVDVTSQDVDFVGCRAFNPADSGLQASGGHRIGFSGCTVHHDGSGGVHATGFGGIRLTNGAKNCTASNIRIKGMDRGVFVASTASNGHSFSAISVENAGRQGVLDEVGDSTYNGIFVRNPGQGAIAGEKDGFRFTAGSVQVNGCKALDDQGTPTMEHGMRISGGANSIIDNFLSSGSAAGGRGLLIDAGVTNTILGNCNLTDVDGVGLSDSGTNTHARNINGDIKSENFGNAAITPNANGIGTIAHGVVGTPPFVTVSIRGDTVNHADLQAINSINITVRIKDSNGADVTSGTFTVDWIARSRP